MTGGAECVRVRDLRVRAGGRVLLDLPDLDVHPGEVLAVLGPNGSGKSTLLRSLLGFVSVREGEVHVLGAAVRELGWRGLGRLRRRIGYMPQSLPPSGEMPLTVREVVAIGRTGRRGLLRPLSREDWAIVDEWLDRLGLAALARARYGSCSGGEQRKALLAKAMAQRPELLVLDEPTANLDLRWREEVVQAIERVHAQMHVTTLLVCHEPEVLPAACRRAVLLESGHVIARGAPEEVLTPERMRAMYGANLRVVRGGGRLSVVPVREQEVTA